MAIALDSVSRVDAYTNFEPDWNHTVGSGSNRLLIVSVAVSRGSFARGASGATYNGTAMTLIQGWSATTSALQTYYLINPDSGTHKVKISVTGVDSAYTIEARAMSLTGVHQTTAIGEYGYRAGSVSASTEYSVELDDLWSNSWVFGSSDSWEDTTPTSTASVGSGETSRWNQKYIDGNSNERIHTGSTILNSTAGDSQEIKRTFNIAGNAVILASEIRSADGSAPIQPKELSESATISDNFSFTLQRGIKESVSVSETTSPSRAYILNKSESMTTTAGVANTPNKVVKEQFSVTALFANLTSKQITESFSVSDIINIIDTYLVEIKESIKTFDYNRFFRGGWRVGLWTKKDKKL